MLPDYKRIFRKVNVRQLNRFRRDLPELFHCVDKKTFGAYIITTLNVAEVEISLIF